MNRDIRVYLELDSLWDVRRCIVQKLLTRDIEGDEAKKESGDALWDMHYAKSYKERRIDNFENKSLGITQEMYEEAYKNRSVSDFLAYYPSNLPGHLLKTIIDIEQMAEQPIELRSIALTINTWPYVLDEEMHDLLVDTLNRRFSKKYELNLVYGDPKEFTATFYRQFQYVFKYDILTRDYEWFMRSLASCPIPGTTFLVPSIYHKLDTALTGTPDQVIFFLSVPLAPAVKLVPVATHIYDYAEL